MMSSASRDRSTAIIANTNAASAAKSRGGGGVDRIIRRGVETEFFGDRVGIQAQRRAGQRPGSVRRHRGPLVEVGDPVHIAQQRVGVGQQMVGQQDRLRGLQVRLAGHDRRRVGGGLGRPAPRRRRARRRRPGAPRRAATSGTAWPPGRFATGPPAAGHRGRGPTRSISPRSSAACTSSSVTSGRKLPSATSSAEAVQPGQQPVALLFGQQPGPKQHPGVRLGRGDVVGRQHPVEVGRLAQRGQRVGRAVGEPAAPQRSLVGAHCVPPENVKRARFAGVSRRRIHSHIWRRGRSSHRTR